MGFHMLLLANHISFKRRLLAGLKEYNISSGQPKILDYLGINDGCQQKDIADNCYVETATLSTVLAKMERNGLITREPLEEDRRSYRIRLTDKGRSLVSIVDQEFEKLEDVALEGFSEEEKTQFVSYMERMRSNLQENK